MASKREVRSFLNAVAKKEFGKNYSSLSDSKMGIIRKKAVKLAFRKPRKK